MRRLPSIPSAAFALLFALLAVPLGQKLLNDADTCVLLATGRWIVDHGAVPFWSRTVSTTPKPFCACGQFCSISFPSIRTRMAIFSSSRFLTLQAVPR